MKTIRLYALNTLLILLCASLYTATAQDVIHTRDSKTIEAKVLEINDVGISYKRFDNLEGPTFKMAADKIVKIVFENGTEYAYLEESANHGVSSTATLAELTADGNNVFIEFEDQTGTFDEKDQFLREYIEELTPWKIVAVKDNADFVLSVTGYSKRTAKSFASDTYFLTATIKRVDGTAVWTGKEVNDVANLYNGYGAVRGVSKKLVEKTLLKEMAKAK